MTLKEFMGFLLLTVGVAAVLLGLGAALRDMHIGWAPFFIGIGMCFYSHRLIGRREPLRQKSAASDD